MKSVSCLLCLVLGVAGCGNTFNEHGKMMEGMRGIVSDTASRLSTGGTGQVAAGAQVINPGLRVSAGVEYYAKAQYEGVSGQITASMQGNLDREVPQDVQDRINRVYMNSDLAASEKFRLVAGIMQDFVDRERQKEATESAAKTPN